MTPKPFGIVKEMCKKFVLDFNMRKNAIEYPKFLHDGNWEEREEDISRVVEEIFDV